MTKIASRGPALRWVWRGTQLTMHVQVWERCWLAAKSEWFRQFLSPSEVACAGFHDSSIATRPPILANQLLSVFQGWPCLLRNRCIFVCDTSRACSFCTCSGLGIQTEVRIPPFRFGQTGIGIVLIIFRFWFINQARAGLPWFMLVYRRWEPDNSSKIAGRYNYKQVGRDLWGHRPFWDFYFHKNRFFSFSNTYKNRHATWSTFWRWSAKKFEPSFLQNVWKWFQQKIGMFMLKNQNDGATLKTW